MQQRPDSTVLRWAALGLMGAALAATLAPAQGGTTSRPSSRAAREKATVPEPRKKVVRVRGVRWQPTLEAALSAAAKSRPAKPVVWFRVLGELEGFA
jgi:hypothetical protein